MQRERGDGYIYKRGQIWWVQYCRRGRVYRESSRSRDGRDAKKLLRRRLGEIATNRHAPEAEKLTFDHLVMMVEEDYRLNGRRSLRRTQQSFAHLRDHFGFDRAIDITTDRLTAYANARVAEGAAAATAVNELAALKRGFSLAKRAGRLVQVPAFPTIQLDNARTGFFEETEFHGLLRELPEYLRPIASFAYYTGWRVASEILPLKWAQVDLDKGAVRLEPVDHEEPRGPRVPGGRLPRARRSSAWVSACKRAGLVGLIPHDFRRTAVRNLERAGVSRSVAMKLVGHKTESIYRRYAIVSQRDLAEGVEKLASFHAGQVQGGSARRSARVMTQF